MSAAPYGQTSSTLWGPTILELASGNPIEISVHTLPRPLQREFNHVFHDENLNVESIHDGEFLVLPTNQRAREDLVGTGDHVELEKDRLLNVFFSFARNLCQRLTQAGYWADFIDPCSGLPMLTMNCNKVYSEVDGMECCLNYKCYNAGFCKILTHPKWGSSVYPASIFCYAPREAVIALVQSYPVKR
jgi:hypothetical protein